MNIASPVFSPEPHTRTATVLVVEDEVLIRMGIAAHLQESGFKVLEATTAAEAMQILDVDLVPVDLVFSDVIMPGEMDGFALARWIHERRPELPVVLTSGDEGKRRTAAEANGRGDPFFPKPYDAMAVASRIKRMIVGAYAA